MPITDDTVGEVAIDELKGFGLKIAQPVKGYRFSLDPVLLASFVNLGEGDRVVDLGTGSGIIPLLLARRTRRATVVGIEFQPQMADLARYNVDLNGHQERISILTEDVVNLKRHFPVSSFDLVVSNPPYRRSGTGKVSPIQGRDKARHETTAALGDFVAMAKFLVRPGGRVCFVYHPSRLVELLTLATAHKLAPLRLRMIHGSKDADARIFLLELVKGRNGDLVVESPLFVYDQTGAYTDEIQAVFTKEHH